MIKKSSASRIVSSKILDLYGFSDVKKRKAMNALLKETGIMMAFENQEHGIFTKKDQAQNDVRNIALLVKETQEKWVKRLPGLDRSHVKDGKKFSKSAEKRVLICLKTLGFVDQVRPTQKKTDVICILGARGPTMLQRIQYGGKLVGSRVKTQHIVLLAGERYAELALDGSEDELKAVAKKEGLGHWNQLTETHLIRNLYHSSKLSQKNIPTTIIDTPRGDLPRPTTQTTMVAFMDFLKQNPHIDRVVFVSSQPYVAYQKAVIDSIFLANSTKLSYEVVGGGVSPTHAVEKILAELGSFLWAQGPGTISRISDFKKLPQPANEQESVKKTLQNVYGHNPLLYQALPSAWQVKQGIMP